MDFNKMVSKSKFDYGVVMVDLQPRLLNSVSYGDLAVLIPAHIDLLRFCAKYDCPVANVEMEFYGGLQEEIIDELKRELEKVPKRQTFKKDSSDAFEAPGLVSFLRSYDLETICVTGVDAHICIHATIEGAQDHGFNVISARQLIAEERGDYEDEDYGIWFKKNGGVLFTNYQELLALK